MLSACIIALHDWLKKNSRHFAIQSEVKPKPIATRWHTFSRALCPLHATATGFEWFVGQPVCVLCDQRTSFNLQRHFFKTKTTNIILFSSQWNKQNFSREFEDAVKKGQDATSIAQVVASMLRGTYLLLTEFEVRTVSYGPSFFPITHFPFYFLFNFLIIEKVKIKSPLINGS